MLGPAHDHYDRVKSFQVHEEDELAVYANKKRSSTFLVDASGQTPLLYSPSSQPPASSGEFHLPVSIKMEEAVPVAAPTSALKSRQPHPIKLKDEALPLVAYLPHRSEPGQLMPIKSEVAAFPRPISLALRPQIHHRKQERLEDSFPPCPIPKPEFEPDTDLLDNKPSVLGLGISGTLPNKPSWIETKRDCKRRGPKRLTAAKAIIETASQVGANPPLRPSESINDHDAGSSQRIDQPQRAHPTLKQAVPSPSCPKSLRGLEREWKARQREWREHQREASPIRP